MAQFLVETYVPRSVNQAETAALLQSATEKPELEGVEIRYVRSIVVPDDEVCFHVFEAPTAEAVGLVGRLAGVPFDRITEAHEEATAKGETT